MLENLASPEKSTIRRIFDHIAFRYDSLNTLLSFNIDESWRKRAVSRILAGEAGASRLIELGVGTGKFLKKFLEAKSWERVVGADFSGEMLQRARRVLPPHCELAQADIHNLPFENESFELVVASFTLRSVKDRPHFFREVKRILRPGGKAAFLCLTRPVSFFGRLVYAPYLKFYLPFVGSLLSSDPIAYRFLSQSIQNFPSPPEVGREMTAAGFREFSSEPFTFGISTLMMARK